MCIGRQIIHIGNLYDLFEDGIALEINDVFYDILKQPPKNAARIEGAMEVGYACIFGYSKFPEDWEYIGKIQESFAIVLTTDIRLRERVNVMNGNSDRILFLDINKINIYSIYIHRDTCGHIDGLIFDDHCLFV